MGTVPLALQVTPKVLSTVEDKVENVAFDNGKDFFPRNDSECHGKSEQQAKKKIGYQTPNHPYFSIQPKGASPA